MIIKKRNLVLASTIIISFISLFILLGIYGNPFFWDFSLLFDGAYRISLGIFPFLDFAMLPIPLSFFLQAFYDVLFGAGLIAMAINSIVLASILSILFYTIFREHFGEVFSIFLAISLGYSFNGILAFPWYNQLAFFFFLVNFFLLYQQKTHGIKNNSLLVYSFILTILSVFSKTDIGLIHFLLLSVYFFISSKKKGKAIFSYYIFPFLASFVFINYFISTLSNSVYSSSTGVLFTKFISVFSIFSLNILLFSFVVYFLISLLYLLSVYKFHNLDAESKNILYLIIFLNLLVLGSSITSGLSMQTRVMGLPITFFLCYSFFKRTLVNKRLRLTKKSLKTTVTFFIFLLLFSQFNGIGANSQYQFFKSPSLQAFNIFGPEESSYYEKESIGCYSGSLLEKEYMVDLKKIREYIGNERDVVILGPYQFLYCDYNISPPQELPLWMHEGLTYSKENHFDEIKKYFNENKPKIIIEQFGSSPHTRQEFIDYLENIGYVKKDTLSNKGGSINIFFLKSYNKQII